MLGLKSSGNSPASKIGAVSSLVALAVIGIFVLRGGETMAFGDAEAHLNIARRLTDSRTPGPSQIGTVWLPLPHLLMAPFAAIDALWFNGLAGTIPSLGCFVLAATLLFLSAKRAFGSQIAGYVAAAVIALNPNMLYLAVTPMTEAMMAAALAGILYTTLLYRDTPSVRMLLIVAAVSNVASLTRYEGWFLIPFVAVFIWMKGSLRHAVLFAALASISPILWLAHNQFYYGDPLAFYRGPYSAQAILARQLTQGMHPASSKNWWEAVRYYSYAVRDVIGWPILSGALLGCFVTLRRREPWIPVLLFLPAIFYVLSIHSGGTPVFVPELDPFTLYNTRYATALLPFVAMSIASIDGGWLLLIAAACGTFLAGNVVRREAILNSRLDVNARAAKSLNDYRPGSGVIFRFGELAPILRAARIHLREGLYQDNLPQWNEALADPQVFQREEWALAEEGDEVDQAVRRQGSAYLLVDKFDVKGKPAILIYRQSR